MYSDDIIQNLIRDFPKNNKTHTVMVDVGDGNHVRFVDMVELIEQLYYEKEQLKNKQDIFNILDEIDKITENYKTEISHFIKTRKEKT